MYWKYFVVRKKHLKDNKLRSLYKKSVLKKFFKKMTVYSKDFTKKILHLKDCILGGYHYNNIILVRLYIEKTLQKL